MLGCIGGEIMLTVTAVDTGISYLFTVTDGTEENTYQYEFSKQVPEGLTKNQYLQNCKNESLALAQYEIDKKQPPEELEI
jgi:hypothetical protein